MNITPHEKSRVSLHQGYFRLQDRRRHLRVETPGEDGPEAMKKNKFPISFTPTFFFTKSIAFLYRKPQMFYEVEDASEVVIEDGDIIAARCTMVRK